VKLIDTVRVAEAESLGGVVGDEMLYEHVHLNFRGTYVVARTFLQHMAEDLRARGLVGTEAPRVLPLDEVRTALAFTTYEQAMIAKEMLGRLKRAPFTGQSSNADRIAAYEQRDARAAQLLALPESKAAMRTIYEQAITRSPEDWVLRRNFGMSLVAGGDAATAKEHLLAALQMIPDELDTLNALAYAHRQLGETADEARVLAELNRLEPRYRRGNEGVRE
jgi:Flp pilus assembly protein TadD